VVKLNVLQLAKWFLRIGCLALTSVLYLDMTGPTMVPPDQRFALRYMAHTGLLCLICNCSMWLVSTSSGRKHPILLCCLHLPTLLFVITLPAQFGLWVYGGISLVFLSYWVLLAYGRPPYGVAKSAA